MPEVLEPGERPTRPDWVEPRRFATVQDIGDQLTEEQTKWLGEFDAQYGQFYSAPRETASFMGDVALAAPLLPGGRCSLCDEAPEDHLIRDGHSVCRKGS